MNKTAIRGRNKLIAEITYKAGLLLNRTCTLDYQFMQRGLTPWKKL